MEQLREEEEGKQKPLIKIEWEQTMLNTKTKNML